MAIWWKPSGRPADKPAVERGDVGMLVLSALRNKKKLPWSACDARRAPFLYVTEQVHPCPPVADTMTFFGVGVHFSLHSHNFWHFLLSVSFHIPFFSCYFLSLCYTLLFSLICILSPLSFDLWLSTYFLSSTQFFSSLLCLIFKMLQVKRNWLQFLVVLKSCWAKSISLPHFFPYE